MKVKLCHFVITLHEEKWVCDKKWTHLNWHISCINVNVSIGVESKYTFIYMDGLIHVKKNYWLWLVYVKMFYTIVYWLTLVCVHLHSLTPWKQSVPKVSVQPLTLGMAHSKGVTLHIHGSLCRNPSFGLATKAKGVARVRAKRKPGS